MSMTFRLRIVAGVAAWAVLALVMSLLAGQAWRADAAPGDTDATFVPVTPCRLFDFRPAPDNVGPKVSPLGPGETYTQQVTGDNGNCVGIPADATAVAMNVTIVNPTAQSNLRLFPADVATPPLVSNLNWLAGQSPTPNKVDVKLSPDGKVKLLNHAGSVNVIGDIVGYYTNATLVDLAARVSALEAAPRVIATASASSDTNFSIVVSVNEVLAVTVTTNEESRLFVSSNVEVDADGGNNDDAFCYLSTGDGLNSADDISQRVTVDIAATNLARNNIANHGSVVVPAGTHTVRAFCGVNVGGQVIVFDSADMYLLAITT